MARVDRDTLWDMQVFAAVVDGGSIAAGARTMGVSPSATSKRVAALEQRLGVRLLHRTTRQLRVTAEGAGYLERARDLLRQLEALESRTREEGGALSGEIRLTVPLVVGHHLVAPIVTRFLVEHPQVTMHFDLSDRFVDLASEPFDLAVRIAAKLEAKELVARRLGHVSSVLVAAPAYIEKHGEPRTMAQLSEHAVLELATAAQPWRTHTLGGGTPSNIAIRGPMVCSTTEALRTAARAGLGIARLPWYLIARDLEEGRLKLLAELPPDRRNVFLVRASRAYVPLRVRELADVLATDLAQSLAE